MNSKSFLFLLISVCLIFFAVADNKQDGIDYLKNIEQQPDVKKTSSGLLYKVLKASPQPNGVHPGPTSSVTVHYEGKLINGDIFDSSYQRGNPISFGLNQVIPGWTEGLQLLVPGDVFELYIPQELAYGSRGVSIIKPYSALVFRVELIKVDGKGLKDEL